MTEAIAGNSPSATDGTATPELLKSVFRHHPAGVAVVGFLFEGAPAGFTATSVSSVSADPPAVSFSVAGGSTSRRRLDTVSSVSISLLSSNQSHVAQRFAALDRDRFSGVNWAPLATGEPVLMESHAWLRGTIEKRVEIGGSLLVVVAITACRQWHDRPPLIYENHTFYTLLQPA